MSHQGAGSVRSSGWHHSGLVVTDLDTALEFYRTTLGFEPVFAPPRLTDLIQRLIGVDGISCDLVQCASPVTGQRLELLQFHDVPEALDRTLPVWPGVAHTAFSVPDLDAAVAEVTTAGGHVLGELVAFEEGRAAYCRTPDGQIVELEELDPRPGPVAPLGEETS